MLQFIRSRAASLVAKALFILLIISFGAWGITDYIGGGGPARVVAEVGERQIPATELSRAYEAEAQRMQSLLGTALTREQAYQFGVVDRALEGLVADAVLAEESRRLGLAVGDTQVLTAIREQPIFQDQLGSFNRVRFDSILASSGISEAEYVEVMRGDLARAALTEAVFASAAAPPALARVLYSYRSELRVAETLSVPLTATDAVPAPSDSDIRAEYDANPARYTLPEGRDVSYLELSIEALAATRAIPDSEVRAAFESRREGLSRPELRAVEQVLAAGQAQAQEIVLAVASGGAWADAVERISGSAPVPLGTVSREDMLVPELGDAAFALDAGSVSEPVETALGWHVLFVESVEPGGEARFEDHAAALRDDIARSSARADISSFADQIDDGLAAGDSLEQVAASAGLSVRRVAGLTETGRTLGGDTPSLPGGREFVGTAFSLAQGEVSILTETQDAAYYVLRVDGIQDPRLQALDAVRDEISDSLGERRRWDSTSERATAITERLDDGESIEALATAEGLSKSTTPPLLREGALPNLGVSSELVGMLFETDKGKAVKARNADGYVVGLVTQVISPPAPNSLDDMGDLGQTLQRSMATDLLTQYEAALRGQFDVTVNRDAVRYLFEGDPYDGF